MVQGNIFKTVWQSEIPQTLWKRVKSTQFKKIIGFGALYCAICWYILPMSFLQALAAGRNDFLTTATFTGDPDVPNVACFSPHFMGAAAPVAPALQVRLLPVVGCDVSCCRATDAQPQGSWRLEISPLHHCNMLTTSGTKPLWKKGQSWGQSILGWEEAGTESRSSGSTAWSHPAFEKAFPPYPMQTRFRPIIPKYIPFLWWRAATPEMETCCRGWNLFRSLLPLSGGMCSDAAMGGSVNFRNGRVAERAPSPLDNTSDALVSTACRPPSDRRPAGQAGERTRCIPAIPPAFQARTMGLLNTSSLPSDIDKKNWRI